MTTPQEQASQYQLPTSLLFSTGHLWVLVEDLRATVGLSEFLFDLVHRQYYYLNLPKTNAHLANGELIGVIDSLKVAIPLISPLTGRVIETNPDVVTNPLYPMQSPYSKGWLLRLEIESPIELKRLMRVADYRQFLAGNHNLNFIRQT
jgi:glycine cleavage system H protein